MVIQAYIIFSYLCNYPALFVSPNVDKLELLACCLLVLMRIGPSSLHVLSRLTISPPSVDGTVYRHFHTLPTVTVWLGCSRFGCLTRKFPGSHMHAYTVRNNPYEYDGTAIKYI
jgi:hypothetical protein